MKNSKANIFSEKNKKILINSIVENENLNTGNVTMFYWSDLLLHRRSHKCFI